MTIFLTNDDVRGLLTVPECIEVMESAVQTGEDRDSSTQNTVNQLKVVDTKVCLFRPKPFR